MLGRTILAALSCVSLAAAQLGQGSSVLTFTRVPNPVTAGQPQAITYATNDTVTPVSILLRKGPSGDLQTISTLTSNANDGQYVWTPSKELENGSDYALQITQGTQTNYYGPFSLQGGGQKASSSSSSASSTSNQPGTPTGFPAFGAGNNSSSSARNSTTTAGSTNGTAKTTSPSTSNPTTTVSTNSPTSAATTPAATSARPSGSSAEMIQIGSGFAMIAAAFAALML